MRETGSNWLLDIILTNDSNKKQVVLMLAKAEDEARLGSTECTYHLTLTKTVWRMSVNRSSEAYFGILTQDWSRSAANSSSELSCSSCYSRSGKFSTLFLFRIILFRYRGTEHLLVTIRALCQLSAPTE